MIVSSFPSSDFSKGWCPFRPTSWVSPYLPLLHVPGAKDELGLGVHSAPVEPEDIGQHLHVVEVALEEENLVLAGHLLQLVKAGDEGQTSLPEK